MPARLTTTQTAQSLGVSPKQVREYVYQGRLAARCEGRRLYFLPREIEAFCERMPVYGDGAADPKVTTLRRRGAKKTGTA